MALASLATACLGQWPRATATFPHILRKYAWASPPVQQPHQGDQAHGLWLQGLALKVRAAFPGKGNAPLLFA